MFFIFSTSQMLSLEIEALCWSQPWKNNNYGFRRLGCLGDWAAARPKILEFAEPPVSIYDLIIVE
jgi:hypothetical protein